MILRSSNLIAAAFCCSAVPALAVPPAWNHIPADAQVVISIPNLNALSESLNALETEYGVPMEDQGFDNISMLLEFDGVNAGGSAAIAIMDVAAMGDGGEPPLVAIIPVSDYSAFVGNFQGTGDGVEQIWIEGMPIFVKNLDSGFAALGISQDIVSNVGQGPTINPADLLGAIGVDMADSNDFLVVANIPALSPFIQAGLAQLPNFAQNAAMMGGGPVEQMESAFEMLEWLGGGIARDGKSLLFGIDVADDGITLNLGLQMVSGSEFGNYATGGNGASKLLGRVPAKPFFMAGAIDLSGGGLIDLFKKLNEFNAKMAGGQAMPWLKVEQMQEKVTGMSIVVGTPAAMMGGLLSETSVFMASADAAGLLALTQEVYNDMDGQTVEGITYKTSYNPGVTEVDGITIDEWSMGMQFDASNPMMAQSQMAIGMIFGPSGGPAGYAASTEGGAVLTYSKSTANMSAAIKAANNGNGVSNAPGINAVSGNLPANRTFECYMDLGQIAKSIMGLMAMMGGGGMPEIPEDLPPVAAGGTIDDGAVAIAIFIPKKTITGIRAALEPMGIGPADDNDGAPPRF